MNGAIRSMTLIPVSKTSIFADSSRKLGGSRWIGQRSTPSAGAGFSSTGSDLNYNADGSLTLYAGAKSPGKDKENNWLPAPDGMLLALHRAYWADQAILDGTWVPPQVEPSLRPSPP